MGKNNKKAGNTQKSKAKFIGIGIIATIAIAITIAIASGGLDMNSKTSIDTTKGSPILGSDTAPITIIEFGDYQCPYCKKWNQEVKPLIEKNYLNTGKAKLVYVDFPIIGAHSIKAHASSYCANEQGLYWKYHDFLYENQGHENDGWASPENLKLLASKMSGLDIEKFSQCLDSGKYENQVIANKNMATKSGARSTPTFVIIGPNNDATQVSGAQPYSVFESVFAEKLNS